jgi:hypothetical protein
MLALSLYSVSLWSLSFQPLLADIIGGDVTTLAGDSTSGSTNGIGSNSQFNSPYVVSISANDLYALVADQGNSIIRQIIISTATVTTLAGLAASTGTTNGIGTNAKFNAPTGLSISTDGSYALVVDRGNRLIRKIIISTASVSTLAGSSSGSTNGIGTNAKFNNAFGASISADGSFALIADTDNQLIRKMIISTADVVTLAGAALTSGSTNGIGTNAKFSTPLE